MKLSGRVGNGGGEHRKGKKRSAHTRDEVLQTGTACGAQGIGTAAQHASQTARLSPHGGAARGRGGQRPEEEARRRLCLACYSSPRPASGHCRETLPLDMGLGHVTCSGRGTRLLGQGLGVCAACPCPLLPGPLRRRCSESTLLQPGSRQRDAMPELDPERRRQLWVFDLQTHEMSSQ